MSYIASQEGLQNTEFHCSITLKMGLYYETTTSGSYGLWANMHYYSHTTDTIIAKLTCD